jgi:hypothetical protein
LDTSRKGWGYNERTVPRRLSYRPALIVSTIGPILSLLVVVCREVQLFYQSDPDFWLDITNFAVVLLPFAFSILFAFVPDMRTKHIAWRTVVVLVGIGFSWMLWKQQRLAAEATKRDQQNAVQTAINQSNQHSDQKIGEIREDVQGVKSEVQDVKKDLQETVKNSTSSLSESIGKVGKPEPPQLAKLRFTLWTDVMNSEQFPLIKEIALPVHEGSVAVEFTIQNIADASAEDGELWIRICRDCRFAKEPEGFNHFKGQTEQDRHKSFQRILPGIALEKMTAEIIPPPLSNRFEVDLFYGCKNCVAITKPGPNKEVFFINVVGR